MFTFFDNIYSFIFSVIRSCGGSRCYLFNLRSLCCSFFFVISFTVYSDEYTFTDMVYADLGPIRSVPVTLSCSDSRIWLYATPDGSASGANVRGAPSTVTFTDPVYVGLNLYFWSPDSIALPLTITYSITYGSGEGGESGGGESGGGESGGGESGGSSGPWARESTLQSTNTILSQLNIALDSISNYTSVVPFIQRDLGSFFTSFSSLKSVVESMASDLSSAATDTSSINSVITSIKSDTASIKSDTSSIKSDTASIKSDTTSIKSDTSSIKSDTASIKSDTASINNTTTVISTDVKSLQSDISSIKNTLIQNNPSPTPPTRMDRLPVPSNISALDQIKRKLLPPRLFPSNAKSQYVFEITLPLTSGQHIYIRNTLPISVESDYFDSNTASLINDFLSFFRSLFLVLLSWCFVKAVIKTLRQW